MEILVTCIWMFIGVTFYSFVVGSMTSIITTQGTFNEVLQKKLDALENFSEEVQLPDEI
jgi:hypothetical protein